MKNYILAILILAIALQINAQEVFKPSGMTASAEAHKKFMTNHTREATKRAKLWKVSSLATQIIASVQSGAGVKEGFNYGSVLPVPGITNFEKFSTVEADGLVKCIKESRGIEVIAMALNVINLKSGNALQSDKDFLQATFGPGGNLESMAEEAQKAYFIYTGSNINLQKEELGIQEATASTATAIEVPSTELTTPGVIKEVETTDKEVIIEVPEIVETINSEVNTSEEFILEEVVEETIKEVSEIIVIEEPTITSEENLETEVLKETTETKVETPVSESAEIKTDQIEDIETKEIKLTEAEQQAALEAAQLKASRLAEIETLKAKKEELEKETLQKEKEKIEAKKALKDIEPSKKLNKKFSFGIKAGVNAAKLFEQKNDSDIISQDDNYKLGAVGGLIVNIALSNNILIESGALFSMKGSQYDKQADRPKNSLVRNLDYVQIPVHLKTLQDNGRTSFFFQGGPYLGIAVNGDRTETINDSEETSDITFGEKEEDLKLLDFGFGVGTGIQFGHIQFGVSYDFGLTNLSNTTANDLKTKNRVASLFANYLF